VVDFVMDWQELARYRRGGLYEIIVDFTLCQQPVRKTPLVKQTLYKNEFSMLAFDSVNKNTLKLQCCRQHSLDWIMSADVLPYIVVQTFTKRLAVLFKQIVN